ncbi:MAG: FkbM family methyltransferase [Cyanobium sp. D14.bin.5]|nr:FkbM family methyltransferase [Cyanobium sp. D14.bin.5]
MGITSYAQNFEDVMLWRALNKIEKGFYIDIGAAWPEVDSVTKAFYDLGWRGINVEPNKDFFRQLEDERPRDINLCMALGEAERTLELNIFKDTGLSTFDSNTAQRHKNSGLAMSRQSVSVSRLDLIWEKYVPAGQDVHFLKIDVEGFEKQVLLGNSWNIYRPWILLIEACAPSLQLDASSSWEWIVLSAGYTYAYSDGLNRFYVASEHFDLIQSFIYPPNIFDGYKMLCEDKLLTAEDKLLIAEAKADEYTLKIKVLYSSTSWRITKPLRWASDLYRSISVYLFELRPKHYLTATVAGPVLSAVKRYRFTQFCIQIAYRLGFSHHLKRIYFRLLSASRPTFYTCPRGVIDLTPRERYIYTRLKSSINVHSRRSE